MKDRFIRYLSSIYKNISDKRLDEKIGIAIERVLTNTDFSRKVLLEVIDALKEEGYSKAEILAHLNLIDLDHRT
jgi:hypothetical protein